MPTWYLLGIPLIGTLALGGSQDTWLEKVFLAIFLILYGLPVMGALLIGLVAVIHDRCWLRLKI